jgi:hypothetical protein
MVTAKPTPMTTVTSVIICGSAMLTSTHCTASFDGGAESKTGHYLSSAGGQEEEAYRRIVDHARSKSLNLWGNLKLFNSLTLCVTVL